MKKKRLTRIYEGKEVLCKDCKTKKFQTTGDKERYGLIVIHKKNCSYIKKLMEWVYEPKQKR